MFFFKEGNDLIFLILSIADAVSLPQIFERVTSFNQSAKDCLCPGQECEVAASLRQLADSMCLGSVVALLEKARRCCKDCRECMLKPYPFI